MQTQYSVTEDIALVCGDFNISRYPVYEPFYKSLVETDAGFAPLLEQVSNEYNDVLIKKFEEVFSTERETRFKLRNIVDECYPKEREIVSYADTYIDKKTGKEMPMETYMTNSPVEWGSRQLVDYMFIPEVFDRAGLLSHKKEQNGSIRLKENSVSVEKFLVPDLIKAQLIDKEDPKQPRPYDQLSDHYGLSCVFKIG